MSELIDGILRYSRVIRAAREPASVDTQALVNEVVDTLAAPERVRIEVRGRLPVVVFDRVQLSQVFQNLIGNAIQHLGKPEGRIVVSAKSRRNEVEFKVEDDGVGIDPSQFERIFRMFQALHPPRDGGVTGIGLAIVKKIVESHGGELSVESTPGVGTAFRFSVPRDVSDRAHQEKRHG